MHLMDTRFINDSHVTSHRAVPIANISKYWARRHNDIFSLNILPPRPFWILASHHHNAANARNVVMINKRHGINDSGHYDSSHAASSIRDILFTVIFLRHFTVIIAHGSKIILKISGISERRQLRHAHHNGFMRPLRAARYATPSAPAARLQPPSLSRQRVCVYLEGRISRDTTHIIALYNIASIRRATAKSKPIISRISSLWYGFCAGRNPRLSK